jgi:uncharacterized membrane protein
MSASVGLHCKDILILVETITFKETYEQVHGTSFSGMPEDLQHLQSVQQMDLHLRSSWLELAPTGEWTYCSHLHRKNH